MANEAQADEVEIDAALVGRVVSTQFPQCADLPIKPVEFGGRDNRTFHHAEHMSVRLPSAARCAAQVEKEHRWLPRLAPLLPLPIPTPLAMGEPAEGSPWPWSVYQWLDGETATIERIADMRQFATTLAHFLIARQRIDATGGPPPVYDSDTRRALAALQGQIDTDAATAVWEAALSSTWRGRLGPRRRQCGKPAGQRGPAECRHRLRIIGRG